MITLDAATISAKIDERHWCVLLDKIHGTFRTGTFVRGLELVQRVTEAAERAGHHPDVDLRYPTVHLVLVSHDAGGMTERDVALAAEITAIADELGIEADPAAPMALEIAIDALDIASIAPFWQAVLGYEVERIDAEDPSPALVDPGGIGPAVWFQQMDVLRPQRNRIHLDVTVPHDVAVARVAAAIAAGGHLVSDRRAPAFWVLADAEGNEACVCTWQARD